MNWGLLGYALAPLYLWLISKLAQAILRRIPDGRLKRLLSRDIRPQEPPGGWKIGPYRVE